MNQAQPSLRPVDAIADANGGAPKNGSIAGITAPRRRGGAARFITDVVVELGFLPKERVETAVEEGRATGKSPEDVLVESGALGSDQLAKATAERFGLDHVDLTIYKPDLTAVNLLTAQAARRYNAIPIGFHQSGTLLVAMADPSNVLALDDLKLMTGYEVRPVVASRDDIASLIAKMNRLDDAVAEAVDSDDEEEILAEVVETAADAPVIKLVNSIIAQAMEDGASDIHFEAGQGRDMRVRFRVDGVLHETTTIPRRMVPGVVSRVKIMGDLDISERRIPQDGRTSMSVDGHKADIRIVTLPSANGEGVVMRILDKEQVVLTLDSLGMREGQRERFERGFRQSYGAVLVTGPTGSGKSTTLYAALTVAQLDREEHHHDRGPGRVPGRRRQPGAGELEGRPHVRHRAAHDAARRPGHHHGRRDPRPGDGEDRRRVGPHRPPRPLDAPHQRRAVGDHAPHRDGDRAVPHSLGRRLRGRAAPRAPALQPTARSAPSSPSTASRAPASTTPRSTSRRSSPPAAPAAASPATRVASASTRS